MPSSAKQAANREASRTQLHSPRKLSEYEIASHAWPTINWPETDYRAHLDSHGAEAKHVADLYAACAAGHRLDSAWEAIQSGLGDTACRILRRVPTADYDIADLWSDTIAKLIEDAPGTDQTLPDGRKPSRMITYRARVSLLHYLITVAKRIAISRARRKKPELGVFSGDNGLSPHDTRTPTPDDAASDQEDLKRLKPALAQALAQLSSEQRFLVVAVCGRGMKQKQAGSLIGWGESKASRELTAARGLLRQALAGVLSQDSSPVMVRAWCEELEKILKSDASTGSPGV